MAKNIPFKLILEKAKDYQADMTRFLRDMVAIPSESCDEKRVVHRIKEEMEKVGFDKVEIDPMGNVLGYIGHGPRLVAMDAHIDTVGIGNIKNWDFDPYEGMETDELIGGRGTSDQEGGMASMVYAGKIIKDLGLEDEYTLLVTGTVQEEDCDGLCWQYIIEQSGIRPEFVVSTEPTDCQVYRGQRGRMEIRIDVQGVSCHGSAPERGDNAIFKMGPILGELQELSQRLGYDEFLGKGTLTVSEIFFTSPSRCAVADSCAVSIDRRLTWGETWEGALDEIRALPAVQKANAVVSMYNYDRPSWTGLVYPTECYFPTWKVEEDHFTVKALVNAYEGLFGKAPVVDKWTFSTNGVSIMGRHGIPVIGFGPGKEPEAHAPNEKTLEISPGNLCRYVRCNPIKLAGNRIITLHLFPLRFTGGFLEFAMRVLIKNGIVVNADGQAKQDLLIESGIVRQLGTDISPQLPCEEIDASGCYVFPGGVDVHTHFNIDVGIARSCDDFLPVPAQLRVAVQQPLLTIWDLAQMAAGYAINWKFIAVMPPTKQSSTTAFTVSFNILITLSSTKFR